MPQGTVTSELLGELAPRELIRNLKDALEVSASQEATILEVEDENASLKKDVDTLLELLEEEKRVNAELNKMIQTSNKSAASLEKQNEKLKAKLKNKGVELAPIEEQNRLRREVDVLTASQAHLIDSLDASADELDKVTRENGALVEAVARLRASCVAYENQVQEHLKVEGRLKDFLEEGAQYIDGKVSISREGGGSHEEGDLDPKYDELAKAKAHVSTLEDSVTRWQAKCGSLEIQVMALCAELNRLSTCVGGMQAFTLSALEDLQGKCEQKGNWAQKL